MDSRSIETLSALVDTLLPAGDATGEGEPYPSASDVGVVRDISERVEGLPEELRRSFEQLLRAVESRPANLLLTGRPVRFRSLSATRREAYLCSWATSRLALKRRGFQALKRLAAGAFYSRAAGPSGHPLWARIGYVLPEVDSVPERPDLPTPAAVSGPIDQSTDVAIVGSGAGASVIAARAARAGWRVTLLESGSWIPSGSYPRSEATAWGQMFLGRGAVTSSDTAIGFLAGATVGGGTTVNWMTCLPPRIEARQEWAERAGWEMVGGGAFDHAVAQVSARLGVGTTESDVNPSNEALRRGCRVLGYQEGADWGIIPRNAVGCQGRCGFCTFGCPYGSRRGAVETFLDDALRSGARLYASTHVDRVVVERGRASAVEATYRDGSHTYPVRVRARAIVLAAGALSTPAILLRSDVRFPGVGIGLRLDPTTAMAGEFPFPVRPWEGPPQTVGVYRFQAVDPGAHGPWIETAPAHPGLAAIALPWVSAASHRERMERLHHVATPIVLVRDVGEGRVRLGQDGRALFDYTLTGADRRNLVRGLVETGRILRAAGATRLYTMHTPPVEAGEGKAPLREPEWDSFSSQVERRGIHEGAVALFSAHPIGSARAGRDPRHAAARPTGEVYGVDGLWIGDGSLLPTAPGANPMISILSAAWLTADHLLGQLGATPTR